MQYVRTLLESRPFLSRIPDQSLLVSAEGTGADHVQATRDSDGSYAFVYLPTGQPVKVDLRKLSGSRLRAAWFDPRTGTAQAIGEYANDQPREFTPPSNGPGHDWVLLLDDVNRKFLLPGTKSQEK